MVFSRPLLDDVNHRNLVKTGMPRNIRKYGYSQNSHLRTFLRQEIQIKNDNLPLKRLNLSYIDMRVLSFITAVRQQNFTNGARFLTKLHISEARIVSQ